MQLVIQERGVSVQTSHSSGGREATGRPAAYANVSNLSETLLEGNKDHLLNRARTDLARREIYVEFLNKCIDDLLQRTVVQDRALQNEFVESHREQSRKQEEKTRKEEALRDAQIRSMHELVKMKRAQVQQVDEMSIQNLRKNHDTIHQLAAQLQHLQEQMNSMNDSGDFQDVGSNYSGRLSHVSSQLEMIPRFSCFAQLRLKIAS